jgi:DNA-binding MarR family transcriptional regulator
VTTPFHDEDVARLRVALTRIARSLDRDVETGGLTHTQVWVLGTIASRGPLGLSEVAEIERLNPTMLSRIVGKLVDAGLVSRLADPDDGRAARVEATRAGVKLYDQRRRERSALFARRVAVLPETDAQTLLAALPALEALVHASPAQQPARP